MKKADIIINNFLILPMDEKSRIIDAKKLLSTY
jgi:hypothetical protein